MKVLVFGATGATGKWLVEGARERGHEVTAFVRDPAKLAHADTPHVQGDVVDLDAVKAAMAGQDAVLCALGSATLKRDPDLVTGVSNIVTAMQENAVKRLVYVSTMGVGGSRTQMGWFGRTIIVPLLLRNAVADHTDKEAIITASTLDWTIVRPTQLTNGPLASYHSGVDAIATDKTPGVSRASLAAFMLDQLEDPTNVRAKPNIMG